MCSETFLAQSSLFSLRSLSVSLIFSKRKFPLREFSAVPGILSKCRFVTAVTSCQVICMKMLPSLPSRKSFPPGLHGDNWGSLYKLNTRALPPKPHHLGRTSLTSTARGSKTTTHSETSGSHSTLSSDLQFKTLDSNSSSATLLLPRGFITAFLPTR